MCMCMMYILHRYEMALLLYYMYMLLYVCTKLFIDGSFVQVSASININI